MVIFKSGSSQRGRDRTLGLSVLYSVFCWSGNALLVPVGEVWLLLLSPPPSECILVTFILLVKEVISSV